jgi:hypothetical protein
MIYILIFLFFFSFQVFPKTSDFYNFKNDKIMKELLSRRIKQEEKRILKNKEIKHKIDDYLNKAIKNKNLDIEKCIRNRYSVINILYHSYDDALKELENFDCGSIRLKLLDRLKRIENINKLFYINVVYIENCVLKADTLENNVITQDIKNIVKELIPYELDFKEDFLPSTNPFR